MFVPGAGIAVKFHKVLTLHIIFPQAVEHDMHMDVAAASVMPVRVGADKSLMSGKFFLQYSQPKLLCLFSRSARIRSCLFWVEADDVVVGFDLSS